jgi:putative transcriptional regulator
MSNFDLSHLFGYKEIVKGDVLLAEPFLEDSNFERSVIMICDDEDEGYVGLIQNKPIPDVVISDFIEDFTGFNAQVFFGGPVDQQLLQYIHTLGDKIENSIKLTDELYWGGDFDQIKTLIKCQMIQPHEIRFYLGYSGWERTQLLDEIKEHAWFIANPKLSILEKSIEDLWKDVLLEKGGIYQVIVNSPTDLRLN